MIKKIIGVLAVLAILALIVYTAIGMGTYKSMLPEDMFTISEAVTPEVIVEPDAPAVVADDADVEQITE